MPEDVKVPLILERPFLSTTHVKIDVFKRKITFRVGDEKIIFKSVKPASSLIKRVYMLSLTERMEFDLEARLMGENFILNRSLDPLYGDNIKLNDLNVPLELRMLEEVNIREDKMDLKLLPKVNLGREIKKVNEKVYVALVGYRTLKNPKGIAKNVLVGIGKFLFPVDFIILDMPEDVKVPLILERPFFSTTHVKIDVFKRKITFRGDVIVGEPFCNVSYMETKRFDGIITIRNEDDSVTYQIMQSNPSFKHLTNEQCNKISPFLKTDPFSNIFQRFHTAYRGCGIWRIDFLYSFYLFINRRKIGLHGFLILCIGPRWKEINNVGEVSTI
nr:hypothetical protein [Tanacetum cinerariifolium]